MIASESPLTLAVIVGSTRAGRFGPTVANWFVEHAEQRAGIVVDVIDLAESPLPERLSTDLGALEAAALGAVSPRLAAADAFVVVTPEYNHSYPAPLKTAIDWHYTEWHAKPIGFVSYGGMAGGLRAVEHLRQVFTELHAVTVRETVSFHNAVSESGELTSTAASDAAAAKLIDQLLWFGRALKTARSEHPYAA
ncbi:NADPH-dependent FMN reductase [Nocardia cerradoensis]|uniref:Chromate reductase n=1 Tax=Nocardia cerradoensis TaxID=85688 RepID=A0A231GZ40_9NOCA|nr:NAD(P)H-dependent oxidoreductase [Nocardia cerradoensis]NKY46240.1 NAD(P)H-dependent oxidoreductase [Nocardia cerradoensis]OXR41845.1 Chromate reductase [Nocardia cerradoensis]